MADRREIANNWPAEPFLIVIEMDGRLRKRRPSRGIVVRNPITLR